MLGRRQFRRWLKRSPAEMSRWEASARFTVDLGRHCWSNLVHDRASQMAAALSFHTVFSLLPMVVVTLVVMQAFHGFESVQERVQASIIDFVFPESFVEGSRDNGAAALTGPDEAAPDEAATDEAAPDEAAPDEADPAGAEPTTTAADNTAPANALAEDSEENRVQEEEIASQESFERARLEFTTRLHAFLTRLRDVDLGGLGVLGLLVFIYGATALLSTIERSFNSILGVSGGRPWYVRLTLYYTVITLGPLVLAGGQLLESSVLGMLRSGQWSGWTESLARPLAVLSPLVTSWMVFVVMFVLLPMAHVRKRSAAVGALVSAVLWVIGKELFSVYVRRAGITSVYGAIALVPLFLLWLWITWMIVLFGLEIADALQGMMEHRLDEEPARGEERPLTDTTWLVLLATSVARSFERGETCHLTSLSSYAHLPRRTLRRLLTALEDAQIIRRIADDDHSAYTLARPPDRIRVAEILGVGRDRLLPQLPETGAEERVLLERLRQAPIEAAGDLSLATLTRPDETSASAAKA